jgi:hypothetical protein
MVHLAPVPQTTQRLRRGVTPVHLAPAPQNIHTAQIYMYYFAGAKAQEKQPA